MFHGGTNFGLTNGANDQGRYRPITTSYDYDAPLDEAGDPTDKYFAFREVISRYAEVPSEVPTRSTPAPSFTVALEPVAALLSGEEPIGTTHRSAGLPSFDDLGHDRGIGVYRTTLVSSGPGLLSFDEVRDRAWVHLDGRPVGVLSRDAHETSIRLGRSSSELTVLVQD